MERKGFSLFSRFGKQALAETDLQPGIFLPAERRLGSCITHRSEIVWIEAGSDKETILNLFASHPEYSNFPVCSGTVDSVLGVLSLHTFLASLSDTVWPGLKSLVKKPVFFPETVTILKTLSMLEESGCRLAFIIDEYGGIEGIVTRNGLIGELLQEVSGLEESIDNDIFRRDDGSYLVGGQVRMDEILELFKFPDTEAGSHEYYTLAGYLLSLKGNIPKTGDRIAAGRYMCEIIDMDGHRIDKVLITEISAEPAEV